MTVRLDSAGPAPVARWRVDVATVRKVETTPVGGRRVEASMVRRGQVLEYRRADGTTVRELVSPEAAGASVQGAAVTVGHPDSGDVTPETFRRDAVGLVIGEVRFDGDLAVATFDVNDADAVRRIDSGELREVSLGYRAMIVDQPGTSANGDRYDAIQVGRIVNHAALLPRGGARAGREAVLRLDGAAVQIDAGTTKGRAMDEETKKRIEAIEVNLTRLASRLGDITDGKRIDAAPGAGAASGADEETKKRLDAIEASIATLVQRIGETPTRLELARMDALGVPNPAQLANHASAYQPRLDDLWRHGPRG